MHLHPSDIDKHSATRPMSSRRLFTENLFVYSFVYTSERGVATLTDVDFCSLSNSMEYVGVHNFLFGF